MPADTFYIGVLAGATITIMTSIAVLLSLCGRGAILWKLRGRPAGEAAAQANEIIAPITASVQQPEVVTLLTWYPTGLHQEVTSGSMHRGTGNLVDDAFGLGTSWSVSAWDLA